jgi:hypothetical protein
MANTFFSLLQDSSNNPTNSQKSNLEPLFDQLYKTLRDLKPEEVGIKDRRSYI